MHNGIMTTANAAPNQPTSAPLLAKALLAAGLALALVGCEAPREPGSEAALLTTTSPAAGANTAAGLAAALPASADSFQRGATVPVRQPMPGLEVTYSTPNRRGAAFVQLVQPGSGSASDAATSEYARWLAETTTGARPGRRLAVVEEFTHAGGPGLRCAAMSGSYGRQPVLSTLCVAATGGHVLRLRVTMMRDTPLAGDARAFLAEIARGLPRG